MNTVTGSTDIAETLQLFDRCRMIVVDVSTSPVSVFFAQVAEDERIRFFGWHNLISFSRVYCIGDSACFTGGHCFSETGEIVSVSENGVVIFSERDKIRVTLSLSDFILFNL